MVSNFKPIHFLDVSKHLYQNFINEKEESCYRTAIGRIYYSVFLIIRDKIKWDSNFIKYKGGLSDRKLLNNPHELIIKFLFSMGKEYEDLSKNLETLRDLRNNSDYDINPPIIKRQVETAFELFQFIAIDYQKIFRVKIDQI